MHNKQNPPWVQHGVQRISGRNKCCRGHTRPKWMVLTFAPMLWCILQHHNFCCHSGAVLVKGWSLPWQNLASIGPQDCQGWLVWIPWSDSVFWKTAWTPSWSRASTDSKHQIYTHESGIWMFTWVHANWILDRTIPSWEIWTESMDGLAPYGAQASTGTVTTKFICMKHGLQCLWVYVDTETLTKQYLVRWSAVSVDVLAPTGQAQQ